MKTTIRLLILCIAALAAPGTAPARANPAERIENPANICAAETAAQERRNGIPRHLLTAISMAESGRWDGDSRANVAWPWTVTAGGRGRYFDSRAEALAEVEMLMTQGVRNIDVGCMQVNLLYHGAAFESLDEAFDPRANTAYAAAYLKAMFQSTGNWLQAAGNYHSTTPALNGPYMERVLGFWRQQGGAAVAQRQPGEPAAGVRPTIDYTRMSRLNASFKARRDNNRTVLAARADADAFAANRVHELDDWRDAVQRGAGVAHLAAVRQAEQELKRRRAIEQMENAESDTGFADRRARQLRHWRMRVAGSEPGVAAALIGDAGWRAAVAPVAAER